MVRSFRARPIDGAVVRALFEIATRAPSAGFTQGVDWLIIEGPDGVAAFFEATCDPGFLDDPGPMHGLLHAPLIAVPLVDPATYVARYAEQDKATSGLAGLSASEWDVEMWIVDAGFAVMMLLLAATDARLGALFFRLHRDPGKHLASLGVPAGRIAIGAVAIGHRVPGGDGPAGSPSLRARRDIDDVLHRGRW